MEAIGFVLGSAVFLLFPAIHCSRVAMRKGLSPGFWFLKGLTGNYFAVASVHLVQSDLFPCPHCARNFDESE